MSTPEQLMKHFARAFADCQIFLVGGCLRDQMLGRPINDLDLATDVRPVEIRKRVAPWADSVWVVGEKFGTIGVQKEGVKAEITTFRSDTYDGVSRWPEVAFGDTIEGDLGRRDFTINAMAQNLHTGELIDPYHGRNDLRSRLVRFVSDPRERIREDPLRMLRAIRFCAQLDFELEAEAIAAIGSAAEELARISHERIRDELDAIIISPNPHIGLRLLVDLGLAEWVLPELLSLHLPEPDRYHIKDLLDHTLDTVRIAPAELSLRWAALLHDIAKPLTFTNNEEGVHFYRHEQLGADMARDVLSRLRQPAALIDKVARLVRHHLRIPYYQSEWTDTAVRRLMYELGELLEDALALAEADVRASEPLDLPEYQQRHQELKARIAEIGEAAEIANMKPLLNGNEVMEILNIGPSPRVGEALDYLLNAQLEGIITNRKQAIEALQEHYSKDGP